MKKKILAGILAAGLVGVALFQAIPALAQSANPLDHVVVSPVATTLNVGAVQQFSAQAYDSGNQALTNVSYFWLVTAGGGTINSTTGQFSAGGTPGTYTNTVEVVAVQGLLTRVANATVTVTGVAGPLDHVSITPAAATLAAGAQQQFVAQGYDVNNVAIAGLNYAWGAVGGAGTIDATGLFTAGTAAGTFANAVTATAVQNQVARTGSATVVVTATSTQTAVPALDVNRLVKIFKSFLNGTAFGNFLGGQWQVNSGNGVLTVGAIPGIVQPATSGLSLVILPNGQTAASTFTLPSSNVIQPAGAALAPGDKVVIVTVNGQVNMVVKIGPTASRQIPPGLRKQDDKREGKAPPSGWSHGKKTGWQKSSDESEDD